MPTEVDCGHGCGHWGSNQVPYGWVSNTSSHYTIFPPALTEIILIVFKGTRFWVYTGKKVLGPRSIEKLGLPSSVQMVAGSVQKKNSKVLLFNGDNYWKWDSLDTQPLCLSANIVDEEKPTNIKGKTGKPLNHPKYFFYQAHACQFEITG